MRPFAEDTVSARFRGEMPSPELDAALDRRGDAPLTVVILCDHAHISGGLAQVAHVSACALRRRGHRVIFFAAVPPVAPALIEAGIEVQCLQQHDMLGDPSRVSAAARALWNVRASTRLAGLLTSLDLRRTVVHIHGWSKALSPSVLRTAYGSGVATVHTLHDYAAFCPNGAFYDYVRMANCQLRPLSAACILTNCDARHYAHKLWRVARNAALTVSGGAVPGHDVICISERQRQILMPFLGDGTTVHYVPNPVDIRPCDPADVKENEDFLFIGRLSTEKGPGLLAEATRRAGLKAVFVGEGPAREAIEQALPTAKITGWLSAPEVAARLRRARALVFPSLWYETFGLVVQEALANGVPPIVSDNTTSAAAIHHGVNGLLFRSGSVDSLEEQMRKLADRSFAERIGRHAHELYWREPLSVDNHVDRLEETYYRILSRRSGNCPREHVRHR